MYNKLILGVFVLISMVSLNLHAQITKKILVEEVTGTWCGLCPGGFVFMDSILAFNENAIPAALHTGDPMQTPATNEIAGEYTGGGVPGFMIDKFKFEDYDFVTFGLTYDLVMEKVAQRLDMEAEASVGFTEIEYDSSNHTLTTTIQAEFFKMVTEKELRFNLYIIEDEVVGSENAYHQVNFYHPVDGHPYFQAGNPIQQFQHRYVVRKMLGGAWGSENSFPTNETFNIGDTYFQTYSTPLDESWNLDNIKLVALVQEFQSEDSNRREILNAEEIYLPSILDPQTTSTSSDMEKNVEILNIYPNPSKDIFAIDFVLSETDNLNVSILNTAGQVIKVLRSEPFTSGSHSIQWNGRDANGNMMPKGTYIVRMETEQGHLTQKVLLQ